MCKFDASRTQAPRAPEAYPNCVPKRRTRGAYPNGAGWGEPVSQIAQSIVIARIFFAMLNPHLREGHAPAAADSQWARGLGWRFLIQFPPLTMVKASRGLKCGAARLAFTSPRAADPFASR